MEEEDDDAGCLSPPALPPRQHKTEGNTKPTLPQKAKPVSYYRQYMIAMLLILRMYSVTPRNYLEKIYCLRML